MSFEVDPSDELFKTINPSEKILHVSKSPSTSRWIGGIWISFFAIGALLALFAGFKEERNHKGAALAGLGVAVILVVFGIGSAIALGRASSGNRIVVTNKKIVAERTVAITAEGYPSAVSELSSISLKNIAGLATSKVGIAFFGANGSIEITKLDGTVVEIGPIANCPEFCAEVTATLKDLKGV